MDTMVLPRADLETRPVVRARRRLTPRRAALAGVALAALIGGAVVGVHWWNVGRFIVSTDDAYVGGNVTAIAPKVSGYIAAIAVRDNQAVKAGQLLIQLDDRDYRAALAKAQAAVAGAQAAIAHLAAQRALQQAVIAEAEAGVQNADAAIRRTQEDQVRYRSLAASAAGSVQAEQRADADYRQAVAQGLRARAVVRAAELEIGVLDAERAQAEADLAGAVAARDTATLNLGYTQIRAPIDGVIGNRSAELGAYATPGAQLLSLVPAHGLWVDANFKESQLAGLRPGMPATIDADVAPGRALHGHVASLAPASGAVFSVLPPENATGNFTKIVQRVPVRIILDGSAAQLGLLRPGLSVTADVDTRVP